MNVVVDGSVISYQDIGDKKSKAILFLHGWANDSSSFKELSRHLSGKYRCISMDLPGFGASEPSKEPITLEDFANITAKFLDKIAVRPYVLIGHSNGGAIAINAVASGKIKPRTMVLLASSGIRSGRRLKKTVYKVLAKPAKAGLAVLPGDRGARIKKKLYARIGSDYLVSEHMKETFKNIVAYDVSADAAKVKIPTLLVYGGKDTSTPPEMGGKLHQLIKDSHLEIIPAAGHFVYRDSPQEVTGYIERFIK